jgi:hypothetical protein
MEEVTTNTKKKQSAIRDAYNFTLIECQKMADKTWRKVLNPTEEETK